MLVTRTLDLDFDPTLPVLLPVLPTPVEHRWVAATTPVGQVATSIADQVDDHPLDNLSGGATTKPTAVTIGGLTALSFNGDDGINGAVDIAGPLYLYVIARVPVGTTTAGNLGLAQFNGYLVVTPDRRVSVTGSPGGMATDPNTITEGEWHVIQFYLAGADSWVQIDDQVTYPGDVTRPGGPSDSLEIGNVATAFYFTGQVLDVGVSTSDRPANKVARDAQAEVLRNTYGI